MSISAASAHALLQPFCSNNAGIAISKELVRRILNDQIARTSAKFVAAPSSSLFEKLPLNYTTVIDGTGVVLTFDEVPNPNDPTESFPAVNIESITVEIQPVLNGLQIASLPYTYAKIQGRVVFEKRRLRLNLFYEQHNTPLADWLWEKDSTLRKLFEDKGFTKGTWDSLKQRLLAIDVFAARDIAEAFLEAMEFPDLLGMFVGVEFGNDVRVSAVQELLMLTATTTLRFAQCPFISPAGETEAKSSASFQGGPQFAPGSGKLSSEIASFPQDVTVSVKIEPNSPALKFPSERLKFDSPWEGSSGHVFFYTPIKLLEIDFHGIVKPAVNVSDSGSFGPFGWEYSLTAAVHPSMSLVLTNSWPITFKLHTPIKATGQAGAFIKIGCIKFMFGGAIFDGLVDPLDTEFRIMFDAQRKEVVFESRLSHVDGHDFHFHSFPSILWPLTAIVDAVLGRVAERLVTDQAGKILAVTRIPIARLGLLASIAPIMLNAFPGHADSQGNATFGTGLQL